MRSIWWVVVAVCLVTGGVRTSDRVRLGSYEVHATAPAHATVARRHQPTPIVGPFVAAAGVALAPPRVAISDSPARPSTGEPRTTIAFVRTSRGPPRS